MIPRSPDDDDGEEEVLLAASRGRYDAFSGVIRVRSVIVNPDTTSRWATVMGELKRGISDMDVAMAEGLHSGGTSIIAVVVVVGVIRLAIRGRVWEGVCVVVLGERVWVVRDVGVAVVVLGGVRECV